MKLVLHFDDDTPPANVTVSRSIVKVIHLFRGREADHRGAVDVIVNMPTRNFTGLDLSAVEANRRPGLSRLVHHPENPPQLSGPPTKTDSTSVRHLGSYYAELVIFVDSMTTNPIKPE